VSLQIPLTRNWPSDKNSGQYSVLGYDWSFHCLHTNILMFGQATTPCNILSFNVDFESRHNSLKKIKFVFVISSFDIQMANLHWVSHVGQKQTEQLYFHVFYVDGLRLLLISQIKSIREYHKIKNNIQCTVACCYTVKVRKHNLKEGW
jgi:hypothetical protein